MARLLLVDDDAKILALYKELLEESGHQVRIAVSVDEGLRALSTEEPDVLLMDLRVPELEDGLRLLRALPPRGPRCTGVVVISGWTAELAEHPEQHRVDRVLSKPLRFETLLDSIREFTMPSPGAAL